MFHSFTLCISSRKGAFEIAQVQNKPKHTPLEAHNKIDHEGGLLIKASFTRIILHFNEFCLALICFGFIFIQNLRPNYLLVYILLNQGIP